MKKILNANYKKDSKNYHVFSFEKEKIIATIHILKGEQVPESVEIHLKTPGEKEKGTELPHARPLSNQKEENHRRDLKEPFVEQ